MISYQPAYDPYHTSFRILRVIFEVEKCLPLPIETVRILDFYLLFPFLLEEVRVRPKDRSIKKVAKSYLTDKPFAEIPESRVLFDQMKIFQLTAIESLVEKNWVTITDAQIRIGEEVASIPEEVLARVSEANSTHVELMEAIRKLGCEYELLGKDGLKHRTNLMEFRYDAV